METVNKQNKYVHYSMLEVIYNMEKIIRETGVGGLKCEIWQLVKSLLRK